MNNLLIIRHAHQIVHVCNKSEAMLKGKEMAHVAVTESSNGLSLVVGDDGRIKDFGEDAELEAKYRECAFHKEIDASGKAILPGRSYFHCHMATKL